MSDQSEVKGISEEEREANKVIYAGKRIYRLMCDLKAELVSARKVKVSDADLGTFAELPINDLIAEARKIGEVPEWNADDTPVGKKLTYPKGTTGVNP